jgi:integrase/recombinase XerD
MTFNTIIKKYLRETEAMHSKTTLRNYTTRLNSFSHYIEENNLDPDREGVMFWQKSMKDAKLANATIRQYMVELSVFFDWCVTHHNWFMPNNPITGMKFPKPDPPEKDYFSVDQIKEFITSGKHENIKGKHVFRDWLMVCIMLTSGLRIDSLCRLRMCDINFEKKRLYLDHAKGGKSYSVPLDDYVASHLKTYIKKHRPKVVSENAPVFLRKVIGSYAEGLKENFSVWKLSGIPYAEIDAKHWSFRRCQNLTEAICGKPLTAHSLRHSCAAFMDDSGMPVSVIQEILGHSSPLTTTKYLHGLRDSTVDEHFNSAWGAMLA